MPTSQISPRLMPPKTISESNIAAVSGNPACTTTRTSILRPKAGRDTVVSMAAAVLIVGSRPVGIHPKEPTIRKPTINHSSSSHQRGASLLRTISSRQIRCGFVHLVAQAASEQ